MSKQQQFGLRFYQWVDPNTKQVSNICQSGAVNSYSELQILNRLDSIDTQYIINQINNAESNSPYDTTPISESYEDLTIEFTFPNTIINDILTISMDDFKTLLQEWLAFINS